MTAEVKNIPHDVRGYRYVKLEAHLSSWRTRETETCTWTQQVKQPTTIQMIANDSLVYWNFVHFWGPKRADGVQPTTDSHSLPQLFIKFDWDDAEKVHSCFQVLARNVLVNIFLALWRGPWPYITIYCVFNACHSPRLTRHYSLQDVGRGFWRLFHLGPFNRHRMCSLKACYYLELVRRTRSLTCWGLLRSSRRGHVCVCAHQI